MGHEPIYAQHQFDRRKAFKCLQPLQSFLSGFPFYCGNPCPTLEQVPLFASRRHKNATILFCKIIKYSSRWPACRAQSNQHAVCLYLIHTHARTSFHGRVFIYVRSFRPGGRLAGGWAGADKEHCAPWEGPCKRVSVACSLCVRMCRDPSTPGIIHSNQNVIWH